LPSCHADIAIEIDVAESKLERGEDVLISFKAIDAAFSAEPPDPPKLTASSHITIMDLFHEEAASGAAISISWNLPEDTSGVWSKILSHTTDDMALVDKDAATIIIEIAFLFI
jgi:hypothetical protein